MTSQIVVTCRNPRVLDDAHLERSRALILLAEVHGAMLVAWASDSVSFAWEADLSDGVLGFLSSLTENDQLGATWASGVAEGELLKLGDAGRRSDLAWGPPLTLSSTLSRVAAPGEIIGDVTLELLTHGLASSVGDPMPMEAFPGVLAVRMALGADWRSQGEEEAAKPTSMDAVLDDASHTVPVPALTDSPGAGSQDALAAHKRGALYEYVARLAHDAGSDAGGTIAALRRARDDAAKGSTTGRCQASLALAIALATTGRQEEALLDGLDALARATEAGDDRAVTATLAFLSKLFTAAGRYADGARMRPTRSSEAH